MQLALNSKSAQAMREFAEAMPVAVQNIRDDTEQLISIYQSVADNVGVHAEDFHNMLLSIKKMQETAAQAIEVLPHMLIETSVKIEQYVGSRVSI